METEKRINTLKITLLAILSILLVNPIAIYNLSNNIGLSLIISFVNLTFIVFIFVKFKSSKYLFIPLNISFIISICIYTELIFRINFAYLNIPNLYDQRGNYYFNKPNLNQILEDKEYTSIYKTDDKGFRISYVSKPVKSNRWLFLGDSYTQGAQVNYEEMFTSKLNLNFPEVEVINAGISGFGLTEEVNYLKQEGIKLGPEKSFLILCVLNDFNNLETRKYDFIDYLMDKSAFARYFLFNYVYKSNDELLLGRWVDPFFDYEQDNIDFNVLYTKSSELKRNNLKKVENKIAEFISICKNNKCKPYVVLIPTKEQVYKKYFDQVIQNYKIDEQNIDIYNSSKFIKNVTQKYNVDFIDLLPEFKKDTNQLYFPIDEHINKNGHQKVAEMITTYIKTKK